MDKAHAVIEREPVADFPVVLNESLPVVVNELSFDVFRKLIVRTEDAERCVGHTELRVQRIRSIVREIQRARPALTLLRFVAMVAVEAGLQCVTSPYLRQAESEVVGGVDVQESGERKI